MANIIKIRKEHIGNQKNPNQIANEMGVSWATVNSYIRKSASDLKKLGKRPNRKSVIGNDDVDKAIKEHLENEITMKIHRKQRVTAVALFNILKNKKIYFGKERYFRKLFSKIKKEIGDNCEKTFLELNFPLGEYLQFDHGPLEVNYLGTKFNCYLFCASVPQHSLRYCQVYLKKSFESWGDFHEKAFNFFGGVFPNCIYDNDSVLKITSTMEQTRFSLELENHYDFISIFCNKAAGWEKGAVENAVGTCRRNFLNGRPEIIDLANFNKSLSEKCLKNISEQQDYRNDNNLQDYFDKLHNDTKSPLLKALPEEYEWGEWFELSVNSKQNIRYQNIFYSVPEMYVGSLLKIHISAYFVKIYCANELIAKHKRLFIKGKNSLQIDHYLDQLERKPKAINFAKVLHQTDFPQYIQELKERLLNRMDEERANLEFIKILKMKRTCSNETFQTAIELGFSYGGITSQAILSFISQLQISQKTTDLKINTLPKQCQKQKEIKKDFDLKNYLSLCSLFLTLSAGYLQ